MSLGSDKQILYDILEYKKKINYPILVETGTYHGRSSLIFSEYFDKVYTCDNSDEMKEGRDQNLNSNDKIFFMKGESVDCLPIFFKEIGNDNFYLFLDAHGPESFPVLDELQIVADFNYKPFIFIHDFYCGHENWMYEEYKYQPLNYEYVKPKMDLIYGENNYEFDVSQKSLNPDNFGKPNKRGCGFFYKKNYVY